MRFSPTELPWWKRTTVYQIYPRSFADANADGIGDLAGILGRLDYVHRLGVETIWFSPFYASPQADFGYDISDHFTIAPEYGSLADCRRLIDEIHARGMRVVFDMVLNHTSDQHPWFRASRAGVDDPKRDFYLWRPGRKGGTAPPNNWRSMLGGSGWHRDARTGEWYWASFLPFQPDLNYRHPEVKRTMLDVVRYWLGEGVDGLRLDIFNAIYKDASFADNPRSFRPVPSEDNPAGFFQHPRHTIDHPDTIAFARELRRVVDEFDDPPRFLVGEVFGKPRTLKEYCGAAADGLHMVFLFQTMRTRFRAAAMRQLIADFEREFPAPLLPTWTFGNHDRPRMLDRLQNDPRKGKLLAALQLTVRGVPFIYYGDEIGMGHRDAAAHEIRDPLAARFRRVPAWIARRMRKRGILLNRDASRRPMQWDAGPHAGFAPPEVASTWLPVHPHHVDVNVAAQHGDQGSLLSCYRRLLALRAATPALHGGDLQLIALPRRLHAVLAYRRTHAAAGTRQVAHVFLNFAASARTVELDAYAHDRIHSSLADAPRPPAARYTLAGFEAIVLVGDAGPVTPTSL